MLEDHEDAVVQVLLEEDAGETRRWNSTWCNSLRWQSSGACYSKPWWPAMRCSRCCLWAPDLWWSRCQTWCRCIAWWFAWCSFDVVNDVLAEFSKMSSWMLYPRCWVHCCTWMFWWCCSRCSAWTSWCCWGSSCPTAWWRCCGRSMCWIVWSRCWIRVVDVDLSAVCRWRYCTCTSASCSSNFWWSNCASASCCLRWWHSHSSCYSFSCCLMIILL